jgi:cytoskeletal protein CcmA (bactofilin family)
MSAPWLNSLTTSNFIKPTYVNGFLDVSGGDTINRNGNLVLIGGDASFNKRLFVGGDTSLNGNVYMAKDLTIYGSLHVNQYNTNAVVNTVSTNVFSLTEDISLNGRILASGDASLNGRLFVRGDISLNGNLYVTPGSIPKSAIAGGDFGGSYFTNTQAKFTSVASQVTMNLDTTTANVLDVVGSLSISNAIGVGVTNPQYQVDVGSGNIGCGRFVQFGQAVPPAVLPASMTTNIIMGTFNDLLTTIAADTSLNGRLFVSADTSMNGNLSVGGNLITNNRLRAAGATFTGAVYGTTVATSGALSAGGLVTANAGLTLAGTSTPNTTPLTSNTWFANGITWTASYSSSFAGSAYNIFDTAKLNGIVSSAYYNSTTGAYSGGPTSTTISTVGAVTGEWFQLQSNVPIRLNTYSFVTYDNGVGNNNNGLLPASFYIAGSNDGTTWSPIQYVVFTSLPIGSTSNLVNQQTGTYTITNTSGTQLAANVTAYSGATTNAYTYLRLIVPTILAKSFGLTATVTQACYFMNMTFTNPAAGYLYVHSDTSLNGRLLVSGDSSMNGNVLVGGNIITNNGLIVAGATFTGAVRAGGLVSANAGLTVVGAVTLPSNSIPTTAITGISAYAMLAGSTFTGLVTANNGLIVSSDASLNGNLTIGGNLSLNGNLTVKAYTTSSVVNTITTNLFNIAEDVSLNGRLFVTSDTSLNGNLMVGGNVTAISFNAASDYRIKENIKPLSKEITVDGLKPIQYFNTRAQKLDIGFLAHEVQEDFPYLVTGSKDGGDLQTLNYIGLMGVLVKEIQELKAKVAALEEGEPEGKPTVSPSTPSLS